jgi:hypothetical protein
MRFREEAQIEEEESGKMTSAWANCAAPLIRLPMLGETNAVLMEPWHIEHVGGFRFTVPAGVTSDGASIPRFLWRICGHPLEWPRVYAAMLHDWLYSGVDPVIFVDGAVPSDLTRKEADLCYYFLLRHFGISAWRAAVEYLALRLFGGWHYKKASGDSAGENKETTT